MERWRQANEGVWRQIVPEGSRLVPRPWGKDKPDVLVSFEAGDITVNGKRAGQSMDSDEQTIWTAFHNRKVGLLAYAT